MEVLGLIMASVAGMLLIATVSYYFEKRSENKKLAELDE